MRTLVIIPTKDRAEYINAFIQNLIHQTGEFDLFVADMSSDENYLRNNWFFDKGLHRLQHKGHSWLVCRTEGHNQLFGYQKGLEYAIEKGYDYAIASDDDCVLELDWIEQLTRTIGVVPEASVVAGLTLLPWMSDDDQRCPDWFVDHKDHSGKLDQTDYYHATLIPPWDEPREYEQLYGPFLFKVQDFADVGGFPTFLSPLGFRGEMWPMEACFFRGRKLLIDPWARSYHYSASHGGLKLVIGEERQRHLEADKAMWDGFIQKKKTRVEPP
jgi:glycosyltransferase involved in cell wall biosynthesis